MRIQSAAIKVGARELCATKQRANVRRSGSHFVSVCTTRKQNARIRVVGYGLYALIPAPAVLTRRYLLPRGQFRFQLVVVVLSGVMDILFILSQIVPGLTDVRATNCGDEQGTTSRGQSDTMSNRNGSCSDLFIFLLSVAWSD